MVKVILATVLSVLVATSCLGGGLEGVANTIHHPPPIDTSYSYVEDSNWTGWNKFFFTSAIVGQSADIVSTTRGLKRGCEEVNPLFGSNPSTSTLVLGKFIGLGVAYMYTEWLMDGREGQQVARNIVYGAIALTGFGLAIYNENVECN